VMSPSYQPSFSHTVCTCMPTYLSIATPGCISGPAALPGRPPRPRPGGAPCSHTPHSQHLPGRVHTGAPAEQCPLQTGGGHGETKERTSREFDPLTILHLQRYGMSEVEEMRKGTCEYEKRHA
jgi:hypothetical protein